MMHTYITLYHHYLYNLYNHLDQLPRELDDLIMEKGGSPIRNLVFTTWRSGSTFIGAILNSHPGTFYHFEPLKYMGSVQVTRHRLQHWMLYSYAFFLAIKWVFYCSRSVQVSQQGRRSKSSINYSTATSRVRYSQFHFNFFQLIPSQVSMSGTTIIFGRPLPTILKLLSTVL